MFGVDRNEDGSDNNPEFLNESGVGEDDENCMGDKDDVFFDRVRQALVQRIIPSNPTKLNTV